MSISLEFKDEILSLKKINLPTRHYYFKEEENYIKLLSIGEGIFPNDRIKTNIKLKDSNAIFTTESATKVYPSKKEYGVNYINMELEDSNMEFLNDELILYKDSKLIQIVRVKADKDSTFFYSDILSQGRSYENFDFNSMLIRNKFYCNEELEYLENFEVAGEDLKNYIKRHKSENHLFLKLYIKTEDNEKFLKTLHEMDYQSFCFSKTKEMIIGSISSNSMVILRNKMKDIWRLYRAQLRKREFNLGKQ